MPSQSSIRVPTHEELTELARDGLRIPNQHIPVFVQTVLRIAQSLKEFQERGVHPKDAAKRTRAALQAAAKNLSKARATLLSEEQLIRHFTDDELAGELASLFSLRGIETLTHQRIGPSIDEREIELAIKRSRDGGAQRYSDEVQRVARQVLAENAIRPISNLFDYLIKYMEDQLAIAGPTPRGQPTNVQREFALSRLSRAHPELFGTKPTSSPEGHFVLMCDLVFEAIGLKTVGLETAIARHLARASKQ